MAGRPASYFVSFRWREFALSNKEVKRFFLFVSVALLAACSSTPPPPQARYLNDSYATLYLGEEGVVVTKQTQAARPQEEGYWRGGDVSGAPAIVIDLGSQKAYFYKSGQVVGVSPISSGREGYPNSDGNISDSPEKQGPSFEPLRRLCGLPRQRCCKERRD